MGIVEWLYCGLQALGIQVVFSKGKFKDTFCALTYTVMLPFGLRVRGRSSFG